VVEVGEQPSEALARCAIGRQERGVTFGLVLSDHMSVVRRAEEGHTSGHQQFFVLHF
jgi:hypothetical protein